VHTLAAGWLDPAASILRKGHDMTVFTVVRPGLRLTAATMLVAEIAIHAYLAPAHLREVPYIGVLFVVASVLLAVSLAGVLMGPANGPARRRSLLRDGLGVRDQSPIRPAWPGSTPRCKAPGIRAAGNSAPADRQWA
jgi:hypothetical protein